MGTWYYVRDLDLFDDGKEKRWVGLKIRKKQMWVGCIFEKKRWVGLNIKTQMRVGSIIEKKRWVGLKI